MRLSFARASASCCGVRPLLALVLVVNVAFAVAWALLVPIYGGTDEAAHLDYAFQLYDVGRPFRVARPREATLVTSQARYLARVTDYRRMRYDDDARVARGYGTRAFYRGIDAAAPVRSRAAPPAGSRFPYVAFSYPVGYYALVATVMTVATDVAHGSLSSAFLAARLANCALLLATSVFAYLTFRSHRIDADTSALATLAVGTFPLTSWIAGYVQPDNLAACLLVAIFYAARRLAAAPGLVWTAPIVVCVVALFFTKQQYAVAAWVPALALVAACAARRRRSIRVAFASVACAVVAPALAFALSSIVTPVAGLSTPGRLLASGGYPAHDLIDDGRTFVGYLAEALREAYAGGIVFDFFWFRVTTREFTSVPLALVHVLRWPLVAATLITAVVVMARRIVTLRRIATVARRHSVGRAAILWNSDVAGTTYVLVTTLLMLIFAITGGGLELVGRYWLPVLVPIALFLLCDVAALVPRGYRRRVRTLVTGIVASCAVAADASALATTHARYYGSPMRTAVAPLAAAGFVDASASVPSTDIRVASGVPVRVFGYAVDRRTGLPARRVAIAVDGRLDAVVPTGRGTRRLADVFHDDALARAGFRAALPPRSLRAGRHVVSFVALGADARTLPFARTLTIDVAVRSQP